jgi:hypothetical protein
LNTLLFREQNRQRRLFRQLVRHSASDKTTGPGMTESLGGDRVATPLEGMAQECCRDPVSIR